jgi:monolysocardiolipin acyltransferase
VPSDPAGFDQIMDERRGYPRPIPRPGASVSITVGSPLTPRISPLVDSWRAATKQLGRPPGEAGAAGAVGASGCIGEVGSGNGDWAARANGEHPGGKEAEESMRIKICEILQEGVRELGESVERKEGRMERGEWCHSSRRGGGDAGLVGEGAEASERLAHRK